MSRLYSFLTYLLWPFIFTYVAIRRLKGKEDPKRFPERLGITPKRRPEGKLYWMHGASVGETLSMLSLIKTLLEKDPDLHILVTSGTVTSAAIMQKRLPDRAFHQYVPIDFLPYVRRFLNRFKPDAVFWFESEFWPNTLLEIGKRNIPLFLINGRLSEKSFKRWKLFPFVIRPLLQAFTAIFVIEGQDAKFLAEFGAPNVEILGDIKCAADPLPYDEEEYRRLKPVFDSRPCLLASCSHPGEEEMMLRLFDKFRKKHPALLLAIIPRHALRSSEIVRDLTKDRKELDIALRSEKEPVSDKTDVYLIDTMGELGLFYKLVPIVFMGGSFTPRKGHNFLEACSFGCAPVTGPDMEAFVQVTKRAVAAGALCQVQTEPELSDFLEKLLDDPEFLQRRRKNSSDFILNEKKILDVFQSKIEPYLKRTI